MQNYRLPRIFLASRVLVQQNLHPAMQAQKGGDTHFESLTPACTFLDETLNICCVCSWAALYICVALLLYYYVKLHVAIITFLSFHSIQSRKASDRS